MRVVILLALLGTPAALAQTVYTYCDQIGQQTQCRTQLPRKMSDPSIPLSGKPLDVIGPYRALQENRRANEMLRLEEERAAREAKLLEQQSALLDAQTDVLRQKLQSPRASIPPSDAAVSESADQSLIRYQKYLEQIGACVRLNPDKEDADACIDRLIVSDPDFARTRAERAVQSMRNAAEGKGPFGLPPEQVLDSTNAPTVKVEKDVTIRSE